MEKRVANPDYRQTSLVGLPDTEVENGNKAKGLGNEVEEKARFKNWLDFVQLCLGASGCVIVGRYLNSERCYFFSSS